jgi:HK97 family phage portal protein
LPKYQPLDINRWTIDGAVWARYAGSMAQGIIRTLFHSEKRASKYGEGAFLRWLGGDPGQVTPGNALQLATVFACARVLAESVATLPLELRAQEGRGTRRAAEHPLYGLLHDLPNPEMTSFDLRMTMQAHLAVWGNAYAQKIPDRAGRWMEIWPLAPNRMSEPVRGPGGELLYEYRESSGQPRTFLQSEILHIRGLSADGLVGYSPISVARRAFDRKLRMEQFEQAFYDNNAQPGAVLKHPGQLSDKAYGRLLESWEGRHKGAENANKVAILEEGLDLASMGVPQSDAQFLESQKFGRSEIAAMFRVPLHMINDLDRATFSNIEHLSMEFVIDTLTPWLVAWEQAIARDLLTPEERKRYYAKHKLQARLRGDNASRSQFYSMGLQWGWFSINDVRELEDLNPIADGDTYFVPLNMVPINQAAKGVGAVPATNPARSYLQAGHGDECMCGACRSEASVSRETRADGTSDADEDLRVARVEMARAMEPVLEDVAARVTRREARDVRKLVDKHLRRRSEDEFLTAMREFYNEFDGVVEDAFRAALLSYARQAMLAASAELGKKSKGLTDELRQFVAEYLASMGDGWAASSRLQVEILLAEAADSGADPAEAIDERLTRWEETKPAKVADRHAFEALNALVIASYRSHGVTVLRWMASGASCPFCLGLSGKVAGIEEYFVTAGTSLFGGGAGDMQVSRNVRHGPLHGGCDCVVVAG